MKVKVFFRAVQEGKKSMKRGNIAMLFMSIKGVLNACQSLGLFTEESICIHDIRERESEAGGDVKAEWA